MHDADTEHERRRRRSPGQAGSTRSPVRFPAARERMASLEQLTLDVLALRGEDIERDRETVPGWVIAQR